MTRLLTTGFETGDVAEAGVTTVNTNVAITVVNTGPAPRAGSYCLRVGPTGTATFTNSYKTFALPAAKTEIWLRFAFQAHGLSASASPLILQLNDATATAQLGLEWSATDGLLRLYRGAGSTNLLATASAALAPDAWHAIEVRHQILTATTGAAEVWLNGNRVINFSGDVASTTTLNVQTFQLGVLGGSGTHSVGTYVAYDDIAVNDTAGTLNNGRPGDGRVVLLMPTGAGSSTALTRGGTDTGANYSQVNEIPPSLVQYVASATVAARDLYAMADLGVAVSSINCVEAIALAQNSDAGGGSIGPTIKSGATTNEATAIGLGTTAGYVTSRWETDPNTTAAWTAAGVNALEVGVTVR